LIFLNLRHWNCGFIGPWGFFSIKCDVTTLAISHKKSYSKPSHWRTFFHKCPLYESFWTFFFGQLKKICQNKTDGWTPFLLELMNISPFCVLCTCMLITVFDPITWNGEYLCFTEVVREMKWAIFTYVLNPKMHVGLENHNLINNC
jgi:hypothetical protein